MINDKKAKKKRMKNLSKCQKMMIIHNTGSLFRLLVSTKLL